MGKCQNNCVFIAALPVTEGCGESTLLDSFALNHFSYPDQGWMCAQAPSSQESSITTKLPQVCHLNLSGFHSAEINHLCQYDSRIIFKKLFGFTSVWKFLLFSLPYF